MDQLAAVLVCLMSPPANGSRAFTYICTTCLSDAIIIYLNTHFHLLSNAPSVSILPILPWVLHLSIEQNIISGRTVRATATWPHWRYRASARLTPEPSPCSWTTRREESGASSTSPSPRLSSATPPPSGSSPSSSLPASCWWPTDTHTSPSSPNQSMCKL